MFLRPINNGWPTAPTRGAVASRCEAARAWPGGRADALGQQDDFPVCLFDQILEDCFLDLGR